MATAASLMERLATLPDPRDRRGRRYSLESLLALAVVAMLAGMTSLEAIAHFGRLWGTRLTHLLGFRDAATPSKATYSRLFAALDVVAVEAAWVRDRCPPEAWRHLALDGKALRGSQDGEAPGVHLLTAYAPEVAAVIAQLRVDGKTNEHKAALQLLGVLPLEGKVVTADAMFTHRDVGAAIVAAGGDYLLPVKGNQPRLRADIEAAFTPSAGLSPPAGAAPPRRGPHRDGVR